jgi:hypothetical protein
MKLLKSEMSWYRDEWKNDHHKEITYYDSEYIDMESDRESLRMFKDGYGDIE